MRLLLCASNFVRSHLAIDVCLLVKRMDCDKTKAPSKKSPIMTNRKSPTSFPMSLRWTTYVAANPQRGLKSEFYSPDGALWSNADTTITCLLSDCLSHYGVRCALALRGRGPTCFCFVVFLNFFSGCLADKIKMYIILQAVIKIPDLHQSCVVCTAECHSCGATQGSTHTQVASQNFWTFFSLKDRGVDLHADRLYNKTTIISTVLFQ